jgi:AcrR family transcriptional regulator
VNEVARPEAGEDLSSILDAAEIEFDRLGARRTTMSDIAAAAGVSRPTLYRAFGDRTALIEAVIDRRAGRVAAKLDRIFRESDSFDDRLVRGMLLIVDAGRADELLAGMLRSEHGRYSDPEQIPTPFLAKVWTRVLDEARDAGELRTDLDNQDALKWLTLVAMALVRWPDPDNPGRAADQRLLRTFLLPAFGSLDGTT